MTAICGIIGDWARRPDAGDHLGAMLRALAGRGPGGSATWRAGSGACLLGICGQRGVHAPRVVVYDDHTAVCDGSLFDRGDPVQADERLLGRLARDGVRGLRSADAQFALAVWDDGAQHLTLARDALAVSSGKGWEIAAAMYSYPTPDAKLFARSDGKLAGKPVLTGDAELAKTAAAWFEGGLAASAAKTAANLMAAGTAPSELKTGAGALALAESWDKLKLHLNVLDAKIVKDGIAFLRGTVSMPKSKATGGVAMGVFAVAVREGASWRWTLLQFQAPWQHVADR